MQIKLYIAHNNFSKKVKELILVVKPEEKIKICF